MQDSEILNSWKEIAVFLGRGVRTVQRWEECFGMPVHRPAGKPRSAVIALSGELRIWMQQDRGKATLRNAGPRRSAQAARRAHLGADRLLKLSGELLQRSGHLMREIERSQALGARFLRRPKASHDGPDSEEIRPQSSLV